MACYSPDRLARSYPYQWVVMDELQRQGVRVEFVNQPDLDNHPQAQLLLGVQGLFAEYERSMMGQPRRSTIMERLRLGRLYKLRTGQLMHNAPPYGYRYVPIAEEGGRQWIVDEREAEAVRQIFAWYTGEETHTIWQITQRLNQSYTHALHRAQTWQYSIVHKILKRTARIAIHKCLATRVILPVTSLSLSSGMPLPNYSDIPLALPLPGRPKRMRTSGFPMN